MRAVPTPAALNRRSGAGDRLSGGVAVTWRNCDERLTVRLLLFGWGLGWPSIGVSPSPGGASWPPRTRVGAWPAVAAVTGVTVAAAGAVTRTAGR
jgi:hypothetical protein